MEQSHGLDELNRTVIAQGLCAACGACVTGCPYLTGFHGKTVVLDRCTKERGSCYQNCPMTFFDEVAVRESVFGSARDAGPLGHHRRVVAARAVDNLITASAQAGGVVTALMLMALEKGIIDCAVLTGSEDESGFPHGVVARTSEDILACSGSQYVGAHSLAALHKALSQGFQRIGIVALPCQVRSLRKMALYDLKKENLTERLGLAIGLFCNWAFSSREFSAFVASRIGSHELKRSHIPPPPAAVLELHVDSGTVSIPLDEVRPLIQTACQTCPDMTAEYADVSVGMYEGKPGWNTVIERTSRGAELLGQALAEHWIELEEFPSANLEHLAYASSQKRLRAPRSRCSEEV
jgi:coenzyme F420 hydrogenase subunit beta